MDEGGGGDGYSPAAIVLTPPSPMGADGASRAHIIALLQQSQTRWLKNTEVCDILLNHRAYDFVLSPNAPIQPSGARLPSAAASDLYFVRAHTVDSPNPFSC